MGQSHWLQLLLLESVFLVERKLIACGYIRDGHFFGATGDWRLSGCGGVIESSLPINIFTPETVLGRNKVADEWNKRSSASGLYYGCLAAIDGWLCTIEQPSDVDNPTDFFLGHYQKFGINVQGMCDANMRITYLSVAGNGGTNDAQAFRKFNKLRDWLFRLLDGFLILGDNAYGLTKKLLIPFSCASKQDSHNDTYNF